MQPLHHLGYIKVISAPTHEVILRGAGPILYPIRGKYPK